MVLRVSVVYSPGAREVVEIALLLEPGSSVSHAIDASGLLKRFTELSGAAVGVWGRKVAAEEILRDQDRVEIYRPLKVDPKVARRARFATQGARGAGLFARKRPGAKAGY